MEASTVTIRMLVSSNIYRINYKNWNGTKTITINIDNSANDDYFYSGSWAAYTVSDVYEKLIGATIKGKVSISCNLDSYFKLKELFI